MANPQNQTVDVLLELEDGVAITVTRNGQVATVDKIVDLNQGASVPTTTPTPDEAEFNGELQVEVSAIDIVDNNEKYDIHLQGSNDSGFASGIANLARLSLSDAAVADAGADVDGAVGRYRVPFSNQQNRVTYRFVRLRIVVAGTTPSITFKGRLAKSM